MKLYNATLLKRYILILSALSSVAVFIIYQYSSHDNILKHSNQHLMELWGITPINKKNPSSFSQLEEDRLKMLMESAKKSPKLNSYIWAENFENKTIIQNKYAIISASVPNTATDVTYIFNKGQNNELKDESPRAWGYVFQASNTARAWKQVHYTPIVLLIVDFPNMDEKAKILFSLIQQELKSNRVAVLYFSVPSLMKTRISQFSRILIHSLGIFRENSYLLCSDADIWPFNPVMFDLPVNKTIHITNYKCCGTFLFKNKKYQEYPMTTIGMTIHKWNEILPFRRFITFNTHIRFHYESFYEYLSEYTEGKDINQPGEHGDELWSLDQRFISIKIKDHIDLIGDHQVSYGEKRSKCTFVRPWHLKQWHKVKCWDHSHVPKDRPWEKEKWNLTQVLLQEMYDNRTVHDINKYREIFAGAFQQKNLLDMKNLT